MENKFLFNKWRKAKHVLRKPFKVFFNFLAFGLILNNKKLLTFKIKYIVRAFLLITFILLYLSTWLKSYYLFLAGKYNLNQDALSYQNKTLKSISCFKVTCDDFIEEIALNYHFMLSQLKNSRIIDKNRNQCQPTSTRQYIAKSCDKSDECFLFKKILGQNDLIKMQINNVSNGFYEPSFCLQSNESLDLNVKLTKI